MLLVLLLVIVCTCYSFVPKPASYRGTQTSSLAFFNTYQGPFYIPSRLSAQTSSVLSIDDIAVRWQVRKLGASDVASGINSIILLDNTLEDTLETVQMSRVGGLGLELDEYNVGRADVGLVLVRH